LHVRQLEIADLPGPPVACATERQELLERASRSPMRRGSRRPSRMPSWRS